MDSNTYEYTGLEQTSGLLISRINTAFDGKGNSLYDGETVFDEVYVYRPIGNNTDSAAFSNLNGRTTFNSTTSNPICYLTYGKPGGISISNVVEDTLNNTLSFTFDGYDINIVPSIECADTILVGATTGSNATIDITTNLIDWSVDRKQSWFNVANKYLEDKITLKATMANRTDDRRIGQIDITFKGEVLKTITVVQLGQNESLTNSTPMDLQTFIYPNPVTDVLHISSPNYKISNVKIFDIVGKEILSKDVVNDEIDCSILKPGAYSVELRSSTYITRHKLIKRY